jgi:predicted phage terminase large subunit-like protein
LRTLRFTATAAQAEFLNAAYPKMFVGGVGAGKTRAGVLQTLMQAENTTGCIVAPTYPMLRDVVLPALMETGAVAEQNLQSMRLVLGGNRTVLLRSATHPDRLRGLNLDWFWIDEAVYCPEAAYEVLLGRLRHDPTRYWLTTTPKRDSWVFRRIVEPENSGVAIITAPTTSNPFISTAFAEQLVRQYGTLLARREVFGEWVDVSGAVFKAEWIRHGDTLTGRAECLRVIAVDLAIGRSHASHYTAIVALSYHPHERLYQVDAAVQGRWSFAQQAERIKQLSEWYQPRVVLIESNQYQRALAEHLATQGVRVRAITARERKEERIAALIPLYELGLITHAKRFAELEAQLLGYPDSEYDDLIDALAHAVRYAQAQGGRAEPPKVVARRESV